MRYSRYHSNNNIAPTSKLQTLQDMIIVGKRSDVDQEVCLSSFLETYRMLELLKKSCPLQDEDCYRDQH